MLIRTTPWTSSPTRMVTLLVSATALLGACAAGNSGVRPLGGDAFVVETAGLNGSAAVTSGIAQAQTFCGEFGRMFVMGPSQVGSSSYQLQFRCIAPGNVLPPQQLPVAAAPMGSTPGTTAPGTTAPGTTAPGRRQIRGRRAVTMAEASPTEPVVGAPLAYAAALPPMAAPAFAAPAFAGSGFAPTGFGPAGSGGGFLPATSPPAAGRMGGIFTAATSAPALPPVSTTPLFAPPPGTTLAVAPLTGRRLPPPDDTPMVPLPRVELMGSPIAAQAIMAPAASPAFVSPAFVPPVAMPQVAVNQAFAAPPSAPSAEALPRAIGVVTEVATAAPLPARNQAQPVAIQVPSAPPFTPPSYAPPIGFSLQPSAAAPLPGASNSLPPIAGGNTRPLPLPGTGSSFAAPSGFSQGGIR